MKKLVVLILLLIISSVISAQDIIYKTDSQEIKAKVIEITDQFIKYKLFENIDGPIYNIKIKDVFMIIYENGKKETFAKKKSETTNTKTRTTTTVITTNTLNKKEKNLYISIGLGYGNSYGGFGGNFQVIINQFAIHAGVGYFPGSLIADYASDEVFASGGFKFYFTKQRNVYIDAQFGMFGIEAFQYYYFDPYYYNSYEYSEQKVLYGPSLLAGVDLFLSENFGFNGALGISYNLEEVYRTDVKVLFALDGGIVLRF